MRELRDLRLYFRALADVRRLRMVRLLAHEPEITVKDLCLHLRASQPLVSWHLRVLVRCGLVKTRRKGRQVFCSLNRPAFVSYQGRLDDLLNDQTTEDLLPVRDEPRIVPQLPPLSARN